MNCRKWQSIFVLLALYILSTVSYAQNTRMSIVSQPGDYIGQGQTITSNTVVVDTPYPNGTIQIFAAVAPDRMYSITLSPSLTLPIVPGVYENVSNYGWPSMSVSGDGRGCTGNGRFEILEALFDANGRALRFRANFEYHCGGLNQPGLFGEISIVGPPPPRLVLGFKIDKESRLNRATGRVRVAGKVRCSLPTTVKYALIQITQETKHYGPIYAYGLLENVPCSPQGHRLEIEVEPEPLPQAPPGIGFKRGDANVYVYAYAWDPNYYSDQGYIADHPTELEIDNH
jgi:hypothetical protein